MMNISENDIDNLLTTDIVQVVEDLTGKPADDTDNIGTTLALASLHSATKKRVLEMRGDTTMSNNIDRYIEIITNAGFEKVLELPFSSNYSKNESFYIFAHRDGFILAFDTFRGTSVNGGKLYYNFVPKSKKYDYTVVSSGQFHDDGIWCGDHDCREALLRKISRLKEHGEILPQWKHMPFIWFINYAEESGNHSHINRERIAMLPIWVREMMGVAND